MEAEQKRKEEDKVAARKAKERERKKAAKERKKQQEAEETAKVKPASPKNVESASLEQSVFRVFRRSWFYNCRLRTAQILHGPKTS